VHFYSLNDDINFPDRWYLGDVINVDNWSLLKFVDTNKTYQVKIYQLGQQMDFSQNEAYGVCIVSEKFKQALAGIPDVNFAKAEVVDSEVDTEYYIMSVPSVVKCIDEERSEFQKFEVNDPVRPDKAGEYRGFFKMVVNRQACESNSVFRVAGFDIEIIVSSEIKKALEKENVTGLKFKQVSN